MANILGDGMAVAESNSTNKVSGLVISYNRVNLIGTCLKALSFVDELIVVDKSSTDGTAEIAAEIADRVVVVPWSPVVEQTKAFAITHCTHPWIVCMDDDECLSVEATRFIRRELLAPRAGVYLLPQRHYILGVHDERAYYWPEYQPRFFNRDKISFTQTVHGGAQFEEKDAFVVPFEDGACIHHLSHTDVAQWIEKTNRYTSNPDRVRVAHAGDDLAAFAHGQIDLHLSATKSGEASGYPVAVAILRAVYNIIDRLKTWEEEEGLDGEEAFRLICARLESEYREEFSLQSTASRGSRLGSASTTHIAFHAESPAPLKPSADDQGNALALLRLTLRDVRAAVEQIRHEALERDREAQERERDARARLNAAAEAQELLDKENQKNANALRFAQQREMDLTNRLEKAEQAYLSLDGRLQATLSSMSWRITGPLRRVATRYPRLIRNLKAFLARHPRLKKGVMRIVRFDWRVAADELPSRPLLAEGPSGTDAPKKIPPTKPVRSFKLRTIEASTTNSAFQLRPTGQDAPRRLMCVSHVLPFPPRAGNEYRIHQMLKWLGSEGWEILLIVCPLPGEPLSKAQISAAAAVYPQLMVCDRDGVIHHNLAKDAPVLKGLSGYSPRNLDSLLTDRETSFGRTELIETLRVFSPDFLIELMRKLDENCHFDLLLAEYVFMTRGFSLLRGDLTKAVDTHDVFSTKASKVAQFGIKDVFLLSEEEEAELVNRADIVIGIQPEETRQLSSMAPDRSVINVGVDFSVKTQVEELPSESTILLVASNNPMNNKGLKDFLRFSWPIIRKHQPAAELHVVGDVGRAVAVVPDGVKILGRLGDLDAAYAQAAVVINPTVAGTGLKIKTVEALCQLRPVVTFPAGVDGLGDAARPLLHVATDWFDFARQVSRVLDERPSAEALTQLGVALAHDFSPQAIYAQLARALNDN